MCEDRQMLQEQVRLLARELGYQTAQRITSLKGVKAVKEATAYKRELEKIEKGERRDRQRRGLKKPGEAKNMVAEYTATKKAVRQVLANVSQYASSGVTIQRFEMSREDFERLLDFAGAPVCGG